MYSIKKQQRGTLKENIKKFHFINGHCIGRFISIVRTTTFVCESEIFCKKAIDS